MWIIVVARILKKHLSVIDAMGKIGRWPQDVDVIVLVALYLFSPMRDNCCRKGQKKLLSAKDPLGETE
jgi:hypothetical protein